MHRVRTTGQATPHARLILLLILACVGFSATAAEGELDLSRYRGKIVLVDFWASWCAPCRQSFPWLNAMHSKYGSQGLVVIGVNLDRERSDADRFLKQIPADFEIIFDPSGSMAAHYDIEGMPSSYIFGRDGKLIGRHIGFRNGARTERETELQQLIASASKDSAGSDRSR